MRYRGLVEDRCFSYVHIISPYIDRIHYRAGTQRARFTKKVHKPPLGVNVIDFELNGSLGISKTPKIHDALIEVFKLIRCVKKQVAFLHLF